MTIDGLYDLLENRDFLNPHTADIFSPFFFYTYDATNEYQVRREIDLLKEKLKRPLAMVDTLVLNIYEVMIEYLSSRTLAGKSDFDLLMELDKQGSDRFTTKLDRILNDDEFVKFINAKVIAHLSADSSLKKVYVFLYGFGTIYPYLRAHKLVSRLEQYVKKYKVIIFYPGEFDNIHYQLFGKLAAKNIYRANHLNKLIQ
jgi:hypothetical protein